jgi:aminoglycoside 3'-phosphotransferase I
MDGSTGAFHEMQVTIGESGCTVHRLEPLAGGAALYRKEGRGRCAEMVADEHARLVWLAWRLPVPTVISFARSDDVATLITSKVPGQSARALIESREMAADAVIDIMADVMRMVHDLPIGDCPFAIDYEERLAAARRRIDEGLVDATDFDGDQLGWTAEQVWDALQALLPLSCDNVLTHGDFSLDNILIDDGDVSGCIDVGLTAVADRYQDIGIMWSDLGSYGADLQSRFLDRYGIGEPDMRRLRFHALLNELF